MKALSTDEQQLIRQMVRGEIPWTELKAIGIVISFQGDRCSIENERGVVATADAQDLAKGLLSYEKNPAELRRWAYVLEAGSTFLDLDVENHPAGEKLLQALWKASFGEPVSEDEKKIAQELAFGNHFIP